MTRSGRGVSLETTLLNSSYGMRKLRGEVGDPLAGFEPVVEAEAPAELGLVF